MRGEEPVQACKAVVVIGVATRSPRPVFRQTSAHAGTRSSKPAQAPVCHCSGLKLCPALTQVSATAAMTGPEQPNERFHAVM